ncbi:DUF1854 domain-containing protein [Inhella sp.]|uniref:cyanophycin metabolism-associated DUF1854 family protein n=1 Tax=Inhella sp. TaxID=1921806 RepID=UPI0035B1E616
MNLSQDEFGRLLFDGEPVNPVRAHPISAPEEGISLTGADGHERAWLPRLADVPEPAQGLLRRALSEREFHPTLTRLVSVSTFSTPSLWTVETDRGPLQFHLKSEEDIRRLGGAGEGRLLITTSHSLQLYVADRWALDRHSRRLLERFL